MNPFQVPISGNPGQSTSFIAPSVSFIGLGPILVLLVAAGFVLLLSSLTKRKGGEGTWPIIGMVTGAACLCWSIVLWSRISSGRTPIDTVGTSFSVDGFAVFFFMIISAIVIITSLVAEPYLLKRNLERREFYVLMFLSSAGAMCMAAAGDLIVLFVGLEIMSIALYVMTGYHRDRRASREAALKYFLLGALAAALFIYGSALLYGATGSTNFKEMASFLANNTILRSGVLVAGMFLVLIALAFKVSLVPFHMWTPDVYQGAVTPATGFMSATAKVAGFAGMLRVFGVVFSSRQLDWHPVVWVLAVVSLIVGPILAVKQTSVKRLLAYSSISNAGFILLGLESSHLQLSFSGTMPVVTSQGIQASMFYLLAYSFIVLGSFAVVSAATPVGHDNINRFRGLSQRKPALALIFTFLLLAQAGIPLTSGFLAKFGVISAVVDNHSYAIAIIAMLASVVMAYAYLRLIVKMYMQSGEEEAEVIVNPQIGAALALAVAATFLLVFPQPAIDMIQRATLHL